MYNDDDDDDASAAADGDVGDDDEYVEKKCRETSRIILSFDSIVLCRDLFEFVFRFYFYLT